MPKAKVFSIYIPNQTNIILGAQLMRADGSNVTDVLTSGFTEVGNGFYCWEYTNIPENFRGGVKFYNRNSSIINPIFFNEVDTSNIPDNTCVGVCDTSFADTFTISYSDIKNTNFYALLFLAADLTKSFVPAINNFEVYTLDEQEKFTLNLTESINKLGYYEYVISDTTNIPRVVGDQYYFVEVWQKIANAADRSKDINVGNLKVCWGSEQSMWDSVAKQVWEYGSRTLTQEINCDFTELQNVILNAISTSSGKTIEEINATETNLGEAIQKTFDLLKICCGQQSGVVPRAQILPGNFSPSSPPIRIT